MRLLTFFINILYIYYTFQTIVINNEDLSFVTTIGEGHFGIVDKMVCKDTSMAVKVIIWVWYVGVVCGCSVWVCTYNR